MTEIRLTGRQLKVLAHPLRTRLLTALRVDGPATATRLAETLSTNTGATSYHLRQLADVGLVEEDPRPGGGKQRWWRAAHDRHGFGEEDLDHSDPDAVAAFDWITSFYRAEHERWIQRWYAEQRGWPLEWRTAATMNDYLLRLNPAQLTALTAELDEVLMRYHAIPPGEGDEDVVVFFESFPRPRGGTR